MVLNHAFGEEQRLRDLAVPGARVHQEDFNQILGATGNQKYQVYGGIVNLKRIADVLRSHGEADDMRQLAVMTTLGVAISNLDMHAAITKDDLVSELSSWGLHGAEGIVNDTLEQVQVIAAREEPVAQAAAGLAENARATVQNLLAGRAAGNGNKGNDDRRRQMDAHATARGHQTADRVSRRALLPIRNSAWGRKRTMRRQLGELRVAPEKSLPFQVTSDRSGVT